MLPHFLLVLVLVLVLGAIQFCPARAISLYVSVESGSDENDCLSWTTACRTLTVGVSRACSFISAPQLPNGSTVQDCELIVQPGIYTREVLKCIQANASLVIRSAVFEERVVVDNTDLYQFAENRSAVFIDWNFKNARSGLQVTGLVFRNVSSDMGLLYGAVGVLFAAFVEFDHCSFEDVNWGSAIGTGLLTGLGFGCVPRLVFRSCSFERVNGALSLNDGTWGCPEISRQIVEVSNCSFRNCASSYGGAVKLDLSLALSNVTFSDTTFESNVAQSVADVAISWAGGNIVFRNCHINDSRFSGGGSSSINVIWQVAAFTIAAEVSSSFIVDRCTFKGIFPIRDIANETSISLMGGTVFVEDLGSEGMLCHYLVKNSSFESSSVGSGGAFTFLGASSGGRFILDFVDNYVFNNTAQEGGAVYLEALVSAKGFESTVVIERNIFLLNHARIGGAIVANVGHASYTLRDNVFDENSYLIMAGSVEISRAAIVSITNCTFRRSRPVFMRAMFSEIDVSSVSINYSNNPLEVSSPFDVSLVGVRMIAEAVNDIPVVKENSSLLVQMIAMECPVGHRFRHSISAAVGEESEYNVGMLDLSCEPCPRGHYLLGSGSSLFPDLNCQVCPRFAVCRGANSVSPVVGCWAPWISVSDLTVLDDEHVFFKLEVYRCPLEYCWYDEDAAQLQIAEFRAHNFSAGSDRVFCNPDLKRRGVLCGRCWEDHTETLDEAGTCVPNSSCHWYNIILFALRQIGIVVLQVLFLFGTARSVGDGYVKVAVFYFQMLSVVSFYPSRFTFTRLLVNAFNFQSHVNLGPSCVVPRLSVLGKLAFGFLHPALAFVVFFVILGAHLLIRAHWLCIKYRLLVVLRGVRILRSQYSKFKRVGSQEALGQARVDSSSSAVGQIRSGGNVHGGLARAINVTDRPWMFSPVYWNVFVSLLLFSYKAAVQACSRFLNCSHIRDCDVEAFGNSAALLDCSKSSWRLFFDATQPCFQWYWYLVAIFFVLVLLPFPLVLLFWRLWLRSYMRLRKILAARGSGARDVRPSLSSVKEMEVLYDEDFSPVQETVVDGQSRSPDPARTVKAGGASAQSILNVLEGCYRTGFRWWESFVLGMRLILVGLVSLFSEPFVSMWISAVGILFVLCASALCRPFRKTRVQYGDTLSLALLTMIASAKFFYGSLLDKGFVVKGYSGNADYKSANDFFDGFQATCTYVIIFYAVVMFCLDCGATTVSSVRFMVVSVQKAIATVEVVCRWLVSKGGRLWGQPAEVEAPGLPESEIFGLDVPLVSHTE